MRRTALLAGLVTAVAGGAATFAAADIAPTVTEPARDPFLGSWALMIDGAYAGPVAGVEDCNVRGEVVSHLPGSDGFALKHVGRTSAAPCTIEVGGGMSTVFNTWLSESLANDEAPRTMRLVRTDGKPYALELSRAGLASIALPEIDRASTNPVFVKIGLAARSLRRTPAPAVPTTRARGFAPAQLAVDIVGMARTEVTRFGPWKAEVSYASLGEFRASAQRRVDVGNLPLRVREPDAAVAMDPWVQAVLVEGSTDVVEPRVMLTLSDGKAERFELQFDGAGPAEGDLTARADGSRGYTLYAERVAMGAR